MSRYTLSVTVALPYDEAVTATRAALGDQGFGVLTEIDLAATLRARLDVDLPPQVILGVCRPPPALAALEEAVPDEDLRSRVLAAFADRRRLSEREGRNVESLLSRTGAVPVIRVPELADEVHDLSALLALGEWLFE